MSVPNKSRNRLEAFLAFLSGQSGDVPKKPRNRLEHYLLFLCGSGESFPAAPRNRLEAYLDYLCRHRSGGDVAIVALRAAENGVYTAPAGEAYSPVTVAVPQTTLDTLTATDNGTFTPQSGHAYDEVIVNVPKGIMPSGTLPINDNGTYDVTQYASAEVNVQSGGGDPWEKLLAVSANTLTSLPSSSGMTCIREYLFYNCTNLTNVDFSNISYVGSYSFARTLVANDAVFEVPTYFWPQCFQRTRIPKVVAKKGTSAIEIYCFEQNSYLEAVDVSITPGGWSASNGIRSNAFSQCPNLNALILRQDFFVSINAALPSSCGLSTSGNIYVPSSLVATYKAATNWSTYADRILPIEGSYYETHWANGEAIS